MIKRALKGDEKELGSLLNHRKTLSGLQVSTFRPARGITPGFGRTSRRSQVANNALEGTLGSRRGSHRRLGGRQIAFPGSGQIVGEIASQPKLDVGELSDEPPVLLAAHIGCLEGSQQKPLFAKAIEVFQVKALSVGLLDLGQG